MANKWRRSVVLVMTAMLPSSFVVGASIRNGSENKVARIARSEFPERADSDEMLVIKTDASFRHREDSPFPPSAIPF